MRIGLDIDGVVYNWEAHARRLLRWDFDIHLPVSTYWNFIKDSVTKEQWSWLWNEELIDLFRFGEMYPDANIYTSLLKHYAEVCVITNIPRQIIPVRLQWLLYNNIWFDEFRVTDTLNKSKILPLCDIYIDDSLEVAEDILNNTNAEMIIWDRPWNQNFVNSRAYYRISSWEDIIDIIKRIS